MHCLFSDQASATTLQVARRAITVSLVPRLGGWALHTTRHASFGSPGSSARGLDAAKLLEEDSYED
jgi:hypothetical protein